MTRWMMAVAVLGALTLTAACGGTESDGTDSPASGPPAASPGGAQTPQVGPSSSTSEPPVAPPAAAPTEPARPAAPPAPRLREVIASVGTELRLELTTRLSSETAEVETPVAARLLEPLVVDGLTVVPADAVLHGAVIDVTRAGRVRGRSRLAFRFTEIALDGQRNPIRTRELSFEGEATVREDVTKVGVGAGIGAAIGGIVGGGGGAAKGAAIGGGAGAGAVLATRGREIELPAGSVVTTALASPYAIQVEVR